MKKRLKTNIIIFLIAVPIAVWLFFLTENTGLLNNLSASTISLREQEAMRENNRELWYKNDSNTLDVYFFDLDQIDTQTEYKIISNEEWTLLIQFHNFSNTKFDYKNSLFMLKFNWDNPSILISQATAFLFSWTNKPLSIWLLNQYKQAHD